MSLNVLTAGEGPSLLLLHGFSGSARAWLGCIESWSQTHRVIAPDLLGHGGSDVPTDPAAYALERQAAGLAKLLELLEGAPAAVVGYSMGARLALVLTLAHPQAVERLILESPSAGVADPTDRAARAAADEDLAAEVERDGVAAFIDRWEALPLFASHAQLPESVRSAQRHERTRHNPAGLAGSLRGGGQGAMVPLHDRLGEVGVPTLVVAGGIDPVGLARARLVAEGIPGARLQVVADAGHTPHLERPAEFLRLTHDLLQPSPATA